MSKKVLQEQLQVMKEALEEVQKVNEEEAKRFKQALWHLEMRGKEDSENYNRLKDELHSIGGVRLQTVKTYFHAASLVLKEAYERFGVTRWKDLTPKHTKQILLDKIHNGHRISSLMTIVHSLNFIQTHIHSSHLFESNTIQLTNHEEMINILKGQK